MTAMSDYLEAALLNHVLRNTAYTPSATLYLSLHTADPTDAGTGAEVTGGSYARQTISFSAPSGNACSNSTQVTFTGMPAVTVTHVGIWSASTAGNLLFYGALTASKVVAAGESFAVASAALTVTLN